MATKKPICMYAGLLKELQSADQLIASQLDVDGLTARNFTNHLTDQLMVSDGSGGIYKSAVSPLVINKPAWTHLMPAISALWTTAASGSGAATQYFSYYSCVSGSTNGSTASVVGSTQVPIYIGQPYRCWRLFLPVTLIGGLTTNTAWVGFLYSNTAPSDTHRHFAFKIINGAIWASVANGTTQTIVDTGVTVSATSEIHELYIELNNASVDFYIDGALEATITTNIPSDLANYYWGGYVTNTAAASRGLNLYGGHLWQASIAIAW